MTLLKWREFNLLIVSCSRWARRSCRSRRWRPAGAKAACRGSLCTPPKHWHLEVNVYTIWTRVHCGLLLGMSLIKSWIKRYISSRFSCIFLAASCLMSWVNFVSSASAVGHMKILQPEPAGWRGVCDLFFALLRIRLSYVFLTRVSEPACYGAAPAPGIFYTEPGEREHNVGHFLSRQLIDQNTF